MGQVARIIKKMLKNRKKNAQQKKKEEAKKKKMETLKKESTDANILPNTAAGANNLETSNPQQTDQTQEKRTFVMSELDSAEN